VRGYSLRALRGSADSTGISRAPPNIGGFTKCFTLHWSVFYYSFASPAIA
jgi:hypothetical protein